MNEREWGNDVGVFNGVMGLSFYRGCGIESRVLEWKGLRGMGGVIGGFGRWLLEIDEGLGWAWGCVVLWEMAILMRIYC